MQLTTAEQVTSKLVWAKMVNLVSNKNELQNRRIKAYAALNP